MTWSPTDDDSIRILLEQNPWHRLGGVPVALAKPTRRPLAEQLWKVLSAPIFERYQLVIGPRRVGKTVAMYQTVEQSLSNGIELKRLWWMHLAHPMLMRLELGFLVELAIRYSAASAETPTYLFLDELTYARNWDTWLKSFYDERRPIRVLATSSSTAALRQGRMESGVGRWEEQYLTPCLFTEYLGLRHQTIEVTAFKSLAETISRAIPGVRLPPGLADERQRYMMIGGFPELLMRQSPGEKAEPNLFGTETSSLTALASELFHSQGVLREDAVQKALYLDIPQVFGVGEPLKLERLLYILAGQVTGMVSFATISGDVGLTAPTVEKYISYFERSFLIFMLPNYAPREEAVQRRGRKLYFVDGAVRNAALQRGILPVENPAEMGALLENLAASHLHALCQQEGIRLFHWRQGPLEVDLVYDHPDNPMAFGIASSAGHDVAPLRAFQERYPRFAGRCFLVSPDAITALPERRGDGITIGRLPLDLFLICVGMQAAAAMNRKLAVPGSSR
jgi:uncharacterized protein